MNDNLKCPYCKNDCLHLQAVEVNRGGEITNVDKDGTRIKAGDPSGRGARVTLTLWCEQGHKWTRSFQFHKGSIYVEDETLISGCPGCLHFFTADLWRD
jgi:hypothetical protein